MTRLMLIVDPTRCDGHGVCAELFPERITRDPWGFPIIDGAPISPSERGLARRTVTACPRLALHLVERTVTPTSASTSGR